MYRVFAGNSKVKFQCPPDNITMRFGGQNQTTTLLNGTEINEIKGQKLTEVTMEDVPLFCYKQSFMTSTFHKPQYFLNHFSNLKASKKPFPLIINRYDTMGKPIFKTSINVTLEEYTVHERAEEPDMFFVDLSFKLYVPYSNLKLTKITVNSNGKVTARKSTKNRTSTKAKATTYTVKNGDTLGGIAKKQLGNTKYWINIYTKNKSLIENTAKKNGRLSSSKGKYIYVGTKLVMPSV